MAMPADANPNGDIFGGWLLSQMDLAGGSHAAGAWQMRDGGGGRHGLSRAGVYRRRGELLRRGCPHRTYLDDGPHRGMAASPASDEVRKVTEAVFTYVAIDENRRPRPLPPAA
jgi:acyl-CoA thioesterase YciA